jgi:RNA polymerase sigma factor (sigma-70 family)
MYSGGYMNLEDFYDEYVDKVYKFFYIKSLNKQIAEDLTSETFVSFLNQIDSKQVEDRKKYLYGIMRNVWLEFLKDKYKTQLNNVEQINNFEQYAAQTIKFFDETEEPISRLQPFVDLLPEKQREVLVMRAYKSMNIKETAENLGKDTNYVKKTYSRALKSLRVMLDKPYISEGGINE